MFGGGEQHPAHLDGPSELGRDVRLRAHRGDGALAAVGRLSG